MENIIKIKKLSKDRIKEFVENWHEWYKWNKTYVESIIEEIDEMKYEIKPNNSVYLEDELWDIFWNYMCLLNSFEQEWLISNQEKVFERCYKKFSERIEEVRKVHPNEASTWKKIKEKQNIEKENEHKKKHW